MTNQQLIGFWETNVSVTSLFRTSKSTGEDMVSALYQLICVSRVRCKDKER